MSMDIKVAAVETAKLIKTSRIKWDAGHNDDSVTREHVLDMLFQIEMGFVRDEKAHRWLGWAQAVATFVGCGSLEDMKQINKAA